MEPAIILFSFLIVVGIVGIAILRYQDWNTRNNIRKNKNKRSRKG